MTNSLKTSVLLLSFLVAVPAIAQEEVDDCTQLVESIRISSDGKVVSSENALESRVYFKVVVRGTFEKEDIGFGDTAFGFNKRQDLTITRCHNDPVGVPFGVAIDLTGGTATVPAWGKFNPKHVYSVEVIGRDRKAEFHYQDCRPMANKGTLMADIYKCNRREKIR